MMAAILSKFVNAPGFTIFHTRLWIETLLSAFPRWRDASCIIRLPDGRDALLPMLETDRLGPWRWLDAMPFAFFGGPLVSEGQLSGPDMAHILRAASIGAGWLAVNLDPCELPVKIEQKDRWASLTTHLLSLDKDFTAVEAGFNKMTQRHLRHAEKEGVVARRGYGIDDFTAYASLMQLTAQRWGIQSPYPMPLYAALSQLPALWISLWIAEFRGQTIGGLIAVHYTPGRVLYWGSAFHPAYAHLNPTKLLQREAIRQACERGASIYNMGPSVGFDGKVLDGVRQAKEALGAQPHDYAIAIVMNPWAMRARALRDRIRRRF